MTLNPYQGLKRKSIDILKRQKDVEMTLNPYQGLKLDSRLTATRANCWNDLKSLSGIETGSYLRINPIPLATSCVEMTLNPYQGLKPSGDCESHGWTRRLVEMTLNPYQGLKHHVGDSVNRFHTVEMTLNPYQGLKHVTCSISSSHFSLVVEMTLNPYQGLKLHQSLLLSLAHELKWP